MEQSLERGPSSCGASRQANPSFSFVLMILLCRRVHGLVPIMVYSFLASLNAAYRGFERVMM